jgi:hypothetical protein
MDLRSNILTVLDRASDDDRAEGMSWYDDAHRFAAALDPNVSRAAGIIAALSPLNGWNNNKRKAIQFYDQNGIIKWNGKSNGIGLSNSVVKAERIYRGENPLEVMGSPRALKTRAFYSTIDNPRGDHDPVIDRHAFDIAMGAVTNNKTRAMLSRKGEYTRFAKAYRQAAIDSGIDPAQLQAITWITWRRELGQDWH